MIERKRTITFCLIALATALSIGAIFFIPFENTLDILLPEKGSIPRMLLFLREANFSDKVILSFGKTSETLTDGEFIAKVDEFAHNLNSPLITKVMADFSSPGMVDDLDLFLKSLPEIVNEVDLVEIEKQLSPDAVEKKLRRQYVRLLKPEGSFLSSMIRSDPLDLNQIALKRLQSLTSSFGYKVNLVDGHLMSGDGKNILIIAETAVPMTDACLSKALLDFIQHNVDCLDRGLSVDVVCGHLHTVSNEKVIKSDVQLTIAIASIAFLFIFLFYFRDPSAVLIFLIPCAAVVVSLSITALILGKISVFIIGFGSVIAGISVDYGIHIYVSTRKGDHVGEAVYKVSKPVILSALTTMTVFLAFFFSSIDGYRQLAWFSILSVVISLFFALFVFPHGLRKMQSSPLSMAKAPLKIPAFSQGQHRMIAAFYVIFIVALTFLAVRVTFNSDLSQLDGTEPWIVEAEKRFKETWGKGEAELAMVVVDKHDYEAALELCDTLTDEAVRVMGRESFLSITYLCPPESKRKINRFRWNQFWSDSRKDTLRERLKEKGTPFFFSDNAFDPFFETLHVTENPDRVLLDNPLFTSIKERFVKQGGNGYRIISFFPDDTDKVEMVRKIIGDRPDCFLVSRKEISRALSHSINHEVMYISSAVVVLILGVTLLFLQSWIMSFLALVPAVTGALFLGAVVYLTDASLNVANLISGIVVLGLNIDYGIFMTYSHRYRLKAGTRTAVTLSAVSTLVGAGVLLFADHPALFTIGETIVAGVLSGYGAAVLILPSLCSLFLTRKDHV